MQRVLQSNVLPVGMDRDRRNASPVWDEFSIFTDGLYAVRVNRIAQKFPILTPSQLRVAALISSMKQSREIAIMLRTTEHAVEKIRSRIRQKLGLDDGISLATILAAAIE